MFPFLCFFKKKNNNMVFMQLLIFCRIIWHTGASLDGMGEKWGVMCPGDLQPFKKCLFLSISCIFLH